ncbi:MAG: hypothetical protein QOD07_1436 [Frankiaceae bacterium]|jgi:hypothetical protein|nr:hypothetical protein [Frankiaceae bacterium]
MSNLARRLATVLGLSATLLTVSTTPAFAHTVGGAGATNYESHVTGISPKVAGLSAKVVENGNKLEVANDAGKELIVLGYSGEPYLRISSSGGVEENLRSTATYLNQTRFGTSTVPSTADNKGVEWKHIANGTIAVWHDHRIHWNSTTLPPPVAAQPGQRHHIVTWHVDMLLAGQPVTVTGTLDWIPGPSGLPYDAVMLVLLVAAGALVWRYRRVAAALLVVLTAADVVNTLGVAADRARTSVLGAFGVFPIVDVVWILALVTVGFVARGTRLGWQLLIAVAGWMLIVGGLAELGVLTHSTAPYAWSLSVQRACTAVEVPLGLVLVVAGIAALIPHRRSEAPEPGSPDAAEAIPA